MNNWLNIIRTRITEQTYNSYETLLRVHIRSRIGQIRLSEVKTHDVQKVYAEMQQAGFSARTVRYAHTVLSMAMKKSVELNYVVKNPCDFAELPKQVKEETKAFSPEQASLFLQHAKNNRHGLVFEFALMTGMRPEEYLALRWSDIDFSRETAKVQRALVWSKGGGFKFGEPKTQKSRRSIPLPKSMIAKLKTHRKKQLEHRFKLGQAYHNLDLVFASEVGNPLHYRNITQRHYEKILENAGLHKEGFVLYSLRHSCATLLLLAGVNPKIVAERLGHTSIKMTLDTYSHVLPDMQKGASDKLDTMLYRKSGTPRKI